MTFFQTNILHMYIYIYNMFILYIRYVYFSIYIFMYIKNHSMYFHHESIVLQDVLVMHVHSWKSWLTSAETWHDGNSPSSNSKGLFKVGPYDRYKWSYGAPISRRGPPYWISTWSNSCQNSDTGCTSQHTRRRQSKKGGDAETSEWHNTG